MGPLLALTVALFGHDSYISSHTHTPIAFELSAGNGDRSLCSDLPPLLGLMDVSNDYLYDSTLPALSCLPRDSENNVTNVVATWLGLFWKRGFAGGALGSPEIYLMQQAFTAAAYLAHNLRLTKTALSQNRTLTLNYDLGIDISIPNISTAGIVTVAVLLGLFVCSCFLMSWYASRVPLWSSELDAFAMMRIGAELAEFVPLMAAKSADNVNILDHRPGWIGDAEPEKEVGKLSLGAQAKLRKKRKYVSYSYVRKAGSGFEPGKLKLGQSDEAIH